MSCAIDVPAFDPDLSFVVLDVLSSEAIATISGVRYHGCLPLFWTAVSPGDGARPSSVPREREGPFVKIISTRAVIGCLVDCIRVGVLILSMGWVLGVARADARAATYPIASGRDISRTVARSHHRPVRGGPHGSSSRPSASPHALMMTTPSRPLDDVVESAHSRVAS